MIKIYDSFFKIDTKSSSYVLHVNDIKHLILEYYGKKISIDENFDAIKEKWEFPFGDEVIYDKNLSKNLSLDLISLEYSSCGKGDFNEPSLKLKDNFGYVFDFVYYDYKLNHKINSLKTLPSPHHINEELIIYLKELTRDLVVELHYLVDEENDVLIRNLVLQNKSSQELTINKISSMQLEKINENYELISLYGGWSSEGNIEIHKINFGTYKIDSKTGTSSSRRNPFFMIKNKDANLNNGDVYAFNLIYSGNYEEIIERTTYDKIRIQMGISSYCFDFKLLPNESFETPYAVLTYSDKGINGASQNMHHFINYHIISGKYANCSRPIVINNWEATNFDFDEKKLLNIAKNAKKLGIELFVLDDGWFKGRNNDLGGLGDYEVDLKKLPHGLPSLVKKINKLGLKFGLWFEPESINENSQLFEKHPEYAIKINGLKPSYGRNQLLLNLTKKDVCDYIVEMVNNTLKSCNIEFVKWDMNRNFTDYDIEGANKGEFFHRYYLGLYDVLKRITKANPNILFENCSSGGNRNDLGMYCYFQQGWASDDTDGYQRIIIQSGVALGYPLSTISAHVSTSPSQQLLRKTPLSTRFNVSSFGILGYEMNLAHLSKLEKQETIKDIEFYKAHRELFQYGDFYQLSFIKEENHALWMVQSKKKDEAIIGYFNGLQRANTPITILKACDFINKELYLVKTKKVAHNIKLFGSLINYVSPVKLNENGLIVEEISKYKPIEGEYEEYRVSGDMLNNGAIKLKQEWAGVGFNENVRVLGDFGSRLYYIKKIK